MSGCGTLQKGSLFERAGMALQQVGQPRADDGQESDRYSAELRALFDQPYIDPLTRYLQRFQDDEARLAPLQQVRLERKKRCEAVAARYNADPLTASGLARYRGGYSLSCPRDVAAYAQRLENLQQSQVEEPAAPEVSPEVIEWVAESPPSSQLNDCYLLTRIRNFSEAQKACREPARMGDARAQTNMALIAHAFQDYENAEYWAREAAPKSGDACYLLAQMYAEGQGVEQSDKQAVRWYSQAASHGNSAAKLVLRESPGITSRGSID